MKENQIRTLWTLVAFPVLSLGIALQIKAGIGQSMFNAFSSALSELLGLRIGHVINILNAIFLLIYMFIRFHQLTFMDLVRFTSIFINGYLVNVFIFNVLSQLAPTQYAAKLMLFLLGLMMSSISLGIILAMEKIRFPLESLSLVIGEKFGRTLAYVRMRFDIFFLLSTLGLTLLFDLNMYVREGTLISMIFLSKFLGVSYSYFKSIYED